MIDAEMILEILPNGRGVMGNSYAQVFKRFAVANAGQHEQLRGIDRARRQDHFPVGEYGLLFAMAAVFNADGLFVLKKNPPRMRMF